MFFVVERGVVTAYFSQGVLFCCCCFLKVHIFIPDVTSFHRFAKLKDSAQRMPTDGINSLLYKVENVTEHRLYTQVTVDVREAMPQKLQN